MDKSLYQSVGYFEISCMLLVWYEYDLSVCKIMCGIMESMNIELMLSYPSVWGSQRHIPSLRKNNHIFIIALFKLQNILKSTGKRHPGEWMFEIRITQFLKRPDGAIFGFVSCESANFTWKLLSSSVFCNGPPGSLTQALERTRCERNSWTISLPN